MLITCPACATRYEVSASLLPAAGRTLRCSACRAEWSWRHPQAAQADRDPGPPPDAPEAAAPLAPAEPTVPAEARPPVGASPGEAARPVAEPPPELLRSFDDAETGERPRRAFLAGFAAVTLATAAAVAVYAQRDAIATAIPALADALESYATVVDRMRAALAEAFARLR